MQTLYAKVCSVVSYSSPLFVTDSVYNIDLNREYSAKYGIWG